MSKTIVEQMAGGQRVVQIVLVEDNAGDAMLAREQLSAVPGFTFEIHEVAQLATAKDVLSRIPCDAVLLDINLPDSRGVQTLRSMRDERCDLPVVVLSGGLDDELREQLVAAGAQDIIDKNEPRASLLARSVLYAISRCQASQQAEDIEALVAADPDAIVVSDIDGVVRFVNQAATRLFARPSVELIGGQLGFPVQAGATAEIDIVAGGRQLVGEMRTVPMSWEGGPAHLTAIRDVTEQRSLLQRISEVQKNDALGRLAGGVAHDFNNMLAIVLSAAELLRDEFTDDAGALALLNQIHRASERAASISQQLLVFSRKSPSNPILVELNPLVSDCIDMLRQIIGRHIEIVVDLDPQVRAVTIDPIQLDQILMNLVINARDVLPDRGRISVTTTVERAPTAGCPEPGAVDQAVLSVADDGPGMTEEVRRRVFEPFFTTKEPGKGTGLGLATAYGIVTQAGGQIHVDSEPGRGTVFTVRLPVTAAESAWPVAAPAPVEEGGAGVILVVDDEEDLRSVVTRMLTKAGYHVLQAGDGAEALVVADGRDGRIDLLLTDIMMPEMNGYDLAAALQKRRPDIGVLFMSGFPDGGRDSAAPSTDSEIITKPFGRDVLLASVAAILALGGQPSPGRGGTTPMEYAGNQPA